MLCYFFRRMLSTRFLTQSAKRTCLGYREVQIFSLNYREIFSRYCIFSLIIGGITIETICLYNCIEFGSQIPLGFFLLYLWAVFVAAFAILVIIGSLGDVNRVSIAVGGKLKQHLVLKHNRWFCRFLKSCRTNRIYFSGPNYIKQMTALHMEDFVIGLTVNLLLLKE